MTGQIIGLLFEGSNLCLFLTKSPQHSHTGQILPGGRSDPIQLPLDAAVHGHCDQHNAENDQAQQRDHTCKDRRGPGINGKSHDHGAEHHKRRPEQQPQSQIHTVLHLVHIGSHPGHHGRGTHCVDFRIGQAQKMLHHRMAQPGSKTHSSPGGKILGRHRAGQADYTQQRHHQHHFDYIALIMASNTHIYDFCHYKRNHQLKGGLQQLKGRAKNALFAIAPDIFQNSLQLFHLEVVF